MVTKVTLHHHLCTIPFIVAFYFGWTVATDQYGHHHVFYTSWLPCIYHSYHITMTTIVTTHGYHGYHITMTTVVLGSEDYFDELDVTQEINPTRDWPLSCTCVDEDY